MERPQYLDPNPTLSLEHVSGAQFSESMTWLGARIIDSVTVDGCKLIYIDKVFRDSDETLRVECVAEDDSLHTFVFNPQEDGPVSHMLTEAS